MLLAGERGGASAKSVFAGMGVAAACKFLVDGVRVIPDVITAQLKALKTEFSLEVYPALIGVGYICGPRISSYLFAGGVLGGAVRFLADKGLFGKRNGNAESGILFCSGMIAGEGIIGILLAILAVTGVSDRLDLSDSVNTGTAGGLALLGILLLAVFVFGTKTKKREEKSEMAE